MGFGTKGLVTWEVMSNRMYKTGNDRARARQSLSVWKKADPKSRIMSELLCVFYLLSVFFIPHLFRASSSVSVEKRFSLY
jgi:hypothetical protein